MVLKLKIRRDKAKGIALDNKIENLEISLGVGINIILIVVGTYLLLALSFARGQTIVPTNNQMDLTIVSERLGRIETQLELLTQGGNQGTPNNSFLRDEQIKAFLNQANMVVLAGLATSLFANFLFMIGFGRRRAQPIQKAILPNFGLKEIFEQELLTAILLALILALLPNSAEVFLLPLILHYFIFAFFEIIRLYPNLQIKEIVVKNYSLIILFAELSVWANFLNLLKQLYTDYIYSAWTLIHAANETSSQAVPIQAIIIFPLLTLIIAIPAWLNLRKICKNEKIPAIVQSIQDLERQNDTSIT